MQLRGMANVTASVWIPDDLVGFGAISVHPDAFAT